MYVVTEYIAAFRFGGTSNYRYYARLKRHGEFLVIVDQIVICVCLTVRKKLFDAASRFELECRLQV